MELGAWKLLLPLGLNDQGEEGAVSKTQKGSEVPEATVPCTKQGSLDWGTVSPWQPCREEAKEKTP